MIIARIESLVLGQGLDDALARADAYIAAGADGIMIHSSKEQTPVEILAFCDRYDALRRTASRWSSCPTTYNSVTEDELEAAGVQRRDLRQPPAAQRLPGHDAAPRARS